MPTDTILERISEWLRTTAATALAATARRAKWRHWTDAVTADSAVMVRQEQAELLYQDATEMIWQQDFSVAVTLIDSDDETATIETRSDEAIAALVAAFEADPACSDLAMYGGLLVGDADDLTDEGRVTGQELSVSVTYSHLSADATVKGLR